MRIILMDEGKVKATIDIALLVRMFPQCEKCTICGESTSLMYGIWPAPYVSGTEPVAAICHKCLKFAEVKEN